MNVMKTNFFTISLMLICFCISGCTSEEIIDTTGNIRGKVVDALTDEPLQGVTMTISPKGVSTVTGNDGTFEFVDLAPAQYSIQAQKTGYKTNYKQLSINAGETGIGDMSLAPIQMTNAVQIKPDNLEFGRNESEKIFEMSNYGNVGSLKWNISGVEASWLRITPLSGEIGQGMSISVKVSIDRAFLTEETSTTFIQVNFPGGSKSIKITVEK